MIKPVQEALLVDMTDDDIKEYVGYLWEAIKNLNESMANDEELSKLQEAVKEYKAVHYRSHINELNARLKSARAQIRVRGLTFKLPEAIK